MKRDKIKSLFSGLLVLFVMYDVLALSTYNNDWDGYERMYLGTFESRDFFFQLLIGYANKINLSYSQFYTLIQTFIYTVCVFYTFKFIRNGALLLLGVLLIVLSPNLPILIRYYLAFSIFLLSNITYIRGLKITTAVLLLLSFFTHSAIIICFPVYGLFWYLRLKKTEKLYKKLFFLSIVIGVAKIFIFAFFVHIGLNVFSSYTNDIASILSTIFMDCIYFSWFCASYIIHSKVAIRCSTYKQDKQYVFLYSSVLYPILFILISNIMIIQIRLYEPFVLLALIYMLYARSKYLDRSTWVISIIVCILFFTFIMKYILLGVLTGGISEWFVHYNEILLSNERSILLKLM